MRWATAVLAAVAAACLMQGVHAGCGGCASPGCTQCTYPFAVLGAQCGGNNRADCRPSSPADGRYWNGTDYCPSSQDCCFFNGLAQIVSSSDAQKIANTPGFSCKTAVATTKPTPTPTPVPTPASTTPKGSKAPPPSKKKAPLPSKKKSPPPKKASPPPKKASPPPKNAPTTKVM
jgi:hypothetical protein